jgi:cell division protein FtsI (penicillin-binding protein 3)
MALQTSLRSQRHFKQRTFLVGLILLLAAIGLIVRLVYLQVWTSAELLEKAKWQQMFQLRPFIPRRTITDRNDEVLAIDKPASTLFAHPNLYKLKPEEIAEKLAPILNKPAAKLIPLLSQPASTIKIDSWLAEDVADNVINLRIDGLDLAPQRHRLYPHKDLAAEVLGYVNIDHHGQAGVELSQEKLLERTDQASDVVQDGRGRLIPSSLPAGVLRVDRTRLQLTIDARTQRVARQELRSQLKKYNAKRGAVLVMDAKNGELRALVTEPTYDPNKFDKVPKEKYEVFKNWAVSDLYEPGSTFKPINVAIALEAGAIQSDTVFNDEGALTVGGWPVANFDFESRGAVGPLSISQILQRSSNVGMVHIIQQMKPSVYYGWLERIGLGDISGIDLPAETPSTLKPQEQFTSYVIEPATTAFGQGFSLTPVQLLQMHGILASGGKLLTPHVVKGVINEEGEDAYQPKLNPPRQIFSPGTTAKVLEMMAAVVEEGTGKPARIPGYRLGGKTGTAQKANPDNGGYTSGKITSFVGIFPALEPRYVLLAVIDEPVGADAFGSTVAAPIVKAVIEDIIVADKIPPSHLQELNSDALLAQPSPSADNPAATSTPTNPAPDANSH